MPCRARALVTDVVYTPLITPLLAVARARGNPVVDGLGMLLHQARPGFRAWFGADPWSTPTCARRCSRRSRRAEARDVRPRPHRLDRHGQVDRGRAFRTLGVPVFDADAAVHRLLAPGGAAVAAIGAAFPDCRATAGSTARRSAG